MNPSVNCFWTRLGFLLLLAPVAARLAQFDDVLTLHAKRQRRRHRGRHRAGDPEYRARAFGLAVGPDAEEKIDSFGRLHAFGSGQAFDRACDSLAAVLGARFLDRVGAGTRSAPRDALIASSVADKDRGRAFGLEGIGDNLGAFLGPLLAVVLLVMLSVDIREDIMGGKLIGAVGCSGGTGDQDAAVLQGWR